MLEWFKRGFKCINELIINSSIYITILFSRFKTVHRAQHSIVNDNKYEY
jgi:hypothetical protein